MQGQMDRDELMGFLMLASNQYTKDFPLPKKWALERYLRKCLRELTTLELEILAQEAKFMVLPKYLEYRLSKASIGYDRYWEKRRAKESI